jgi:hypothetical protein
MPTAPAGTILFRREYRGFSGGHLKVWDYFCHATHSKRYRPRIHLTAGSVLDASNPWAGIDPPPEPEWLPGTASALFIAGLDWRALPADPGVPVVNLVQGVRHADADDPRRPFLCRRALRICVSDEVRDAILATGEVNGPVVTIPNGIDATAFPPPAARRDVGVLVAGLKRPELAVAVTERLRATGLDVVCQIDRLPREAYLRLLGRARVAVLLPSEREGFYLPALEAQALGALVVCPDCVGNRSFCRHESTCLVPAPTPEAIAAAAVSASGMSPGDAEAMRAAAAAEVARHGIERERAAFLAILDDLESLTASDGARRWT